MSVDKTRWPNRFKFVATLLVMFGVMGLIVDLFSGLPFTRESRSWLGWLLGIVGLGALYLLAEGLADWIHTRDSVLDPPWKRVLHLALLLALVLVFWAASAAMLTVAR